MLCVYYYKEKKSGEGKKISRFVHDTRKILNLDEKLQGMVIQMFVLKNDNFLFTIFFIIAPATL